MATSLKKKARKSAAGPSSKNPSKDKSTKKYLFRVDEFQKLIKSLRSSVDEKTIEQLMKFAPVRLGLVWDEEPETIIQDAKLPLIKLDRGLSFNLENGTQNVIIEGDNYDSLRVLQFTHMEKIDAIYIDPPYNTGNKDWKYNDRFIGDDDEFKSAKWLNFMNPRLRLAKKLLKADGVVFISVDDHELAHLKILCDEIFPHGFVGNFIWESKLTGGHDSKSINTTHEYILCYSKKNAKSLRLNKFASGVDYPNYDEVTGSHYKWDSLWTVSHGYTENCDYPILAPDGTFIHPWMCHKDGSKAKGIARWYWSKETYEKDKHLLDIRRPPAKSNNKKSPSGWKVYKRVYASEIPIKSVLDSSEVGGTQNGKTDLASLFDEGKIFEYPKPVALIKQILKLVDKNACILDFFAGSGTTGQAILELNNEDQGNRQFILCCNTEASEKDKTRNICRDITRERVKRAIELSGNEKGASFCYFTIEKSDLPKVSNSQDAISLAHKAYEIRKIPHGDFDAYEFTNGCNYISAILLLKGDLRQFARYLNKISSVGPGFAIYVSQTWMDSRRDDLESFVASKWVDRFVVMPDSYNQLTKGVVK